MNMVIARIESAIVYVQDTLDVVKQAGGHAEVKARLVAAIDELHKARKEEYREQGVTFAP